MKTSHLVLACAGILAVAALSVIAFGSPHEYAGPAGLVGAMAVVQSSYSERMVAGLAGMIADMTTSTVDTRTCETTAGIGFGLAVGAGSADKGAILGAGAAAQFLGLSVRDVTLVNDQGDEYQKDDNMGVMTRGDMWVTVGGSVADGNDVTFNASTGVLSSAGASGSQFAISGARWMTTASSGELAVVRLSGHLPSA